jgi:predicted TIM-barrel fold metal-dependent hydrolase
MIIDVHTHLGYDYVFEENFTAENLVLNMDKNGIDACILQPGTTFDLKTIMEQHNAIANLAKKMPNRIFGMANPNPHLSTSKYRKELLRCVNELNFVAVKLHPLAHAVNPVLSAGRRVFETAFDLGIPVMVHTGSGIPWALPSAVMSMAVEFPSQKIILAHSGSAIFSNEASLAAKMCPNIFLETSWMPSISVREFCKTLGANRIMFGSDHSENMASELAKYYTIGLSDEEIGWCLGKTAKTVFKIPIL